MLNIAFDVLLSTVLGIPEKGTRELGPDTHAWDPGPRTLHLGPGARSPGPLRGTRDLGPFALDLGPETLNVGP